MLTSRAPPVRTAADDAAAIERGLLRWADALVRYAKGEPQLSAEQAHFVHQLGRGVAAGLAPTVRHLRAMQEIAVAVGFDGFGPAAVVAEPSESDRYVVYDPEAAEDAEYLFVADPRRDYNAEYWAMMAGLREPPSFLTATHAALASSRSQE